MYSILLFLHYHAQPQQIDRFLNYQYKYCIKPFIPILTGVTNRSPNACIRGGSDLTLTHQVLNTDKF